MPYHFDCAGNAAITLAIFRSYELKLPDGASMQSSVRRQ
jgi:hypothetical protein